jgi:protein O-GlcNAc transferase
VLTRLLSRFRTGDSADGPLALYHAGDAQQAERVALERLATDRDDREALLAQAFLLAERGRGKDAIDIAQRVLAKGSDAQAQLAISRAHASAGRRKPAAEALQLALDLQPHHPAIAADAALLALQEGRIVDATAHLARARGKGPHLAHAHSELGVALAQRGQHDAAIAQLRQAIAADDTHANAHANLGAVLKDIGRKSEAAPALERALQLQPGLTQAAFNLAMLRIDQREWPAAVKQLQAYVAAQPRDADAQYWLGNALMGAADAEGARQAYQAAIRIDAQHARARWGLAMAQLPAIPMSAQEQQQGAAAFAEQLDQLAEWARTRAKGDVHLAVGAQQPFFLAYVPGSHANVLRRYGSLCSDLMGAWARKAKIPKPAARTQGARLRVGIVSGHIHRHSVWDAVLRGWVEHLDPKRFAIYLFHTGSTRDAETEWAASRVERLQQGLGDWTAWGQAVSEAQLDVLVYPEIGMDATTARLASLRLARVQLAGWGHPLTTGLPTIDGYISAEAFEPGDAQQHYTETLHALPRLGCAYRPYGTRPQAPDLAALGVLPSDHVLLAPGVAFKYGPAEDVLWAEIARRCAPCKILFFRGEDGHAARLEQRLRVAFKTAGVDFDRHVRFIPWQPQAGFFGLLQRADVFLDTIGFSGFNTAMQAVECGTPIVAWEGECMRGRFASSILRALGLEAWIARSREEYAGRVVRLCKSAEARAGVRQQMAQRRGALYDDKAAVDAFAALLEQMAAR